MKLSEFEEGALAVYQTFHDGEFVWQCVVSPGHKIANPNVSLKPIKKVDKGLRFAFGKYKKTNEKPSLFGSAQWVDIAIDLYYDPDRNYREADCEDLKEFTRHLCKTQKELEKENRALNCDIILRDGKIFVKNITIDGIPMYIDKND